MLVIIAVIGLLVSLLRLLLQLLWQERKQREQLSNLAPNVSQLPLIGAIWQMRDFQPDNLHEKFAAYVRRYGRSFVATTCGRIVLVTSDPGHVDALLMSKHQLRKGVLYGALTSWLGNGLLLSRGESWHAMRKIITPTFHFSILEQYIEIFDRQSNILVTKLKPFAAAAAAADPREAINIYPHVCLAALDIISEAAMGVCVNAQLNVDAPVVQAVKDVTNILATRFMRPHLLPPLLFRLLWPAGYRKQIAGLQCLHHFTNAIIERRRQLLEQQQQLKQEAQQLGKRFALLDTLLQARLAGASLTDDQIRDEVSTFIFAGHDTTTSAVSFCLYLLSRHATIQQRLFEELAGYYGKDLEQPVCYGDFAALPYLHCVVKESLRLYPPIPAVSRCLDKDLLLGESRLPSGSNVIVLLWQLLRDEQLYADPLRFWPERHLDAAGRDYNIPFSAGPRNCIGQRFALLELKTIVIRMLRHFELLPLGLDVKPSIKIVLRSATGVNLGLKLRSKN
ncbi:cytochrome P450 4ae1 [Drosophila grimshawi]|uniref:GH17585 n=1 Tax=Drosophila grimshawi TaxID=7222 RepID=B4JXE0_DROGR|nr:cytochrome P450 4ae1 [Drosophila grimshawi]EDV95416.1 GH17585 [Drosophila grimshawi]